MRLIAERLIADGVETCLEGEATFEDVDVPPPRDDRRFHVFVSPHNDGAARLLDELRAHQPMLRLEVSLRVTLIVIAPLLRLLTARTEARTGLTRCFR